MAVRPDAKDKFVLAVDHGTSGVKTALFSCRGELIGFETEPTPITFLPGGGAEQDPEIWWQALVKTSNRLLSRGLVREDDVVAVCCSSTFSSTVAVDRAGRHLMNSLTWMDSRGAPYIREVVKGFPGFQGYGLARILPWIYKTGGGPQLSGKDDIAHVLYIQHERPEVYAQTFKFLGSKDYLNLRLTGQAAASYDSIALFWLANTRDPNHIFYDPSLIKKVQVDPDKLPPLKFSIEVLGELSTEAAASLGLPTGVKVVMGSPDHQSACIGSGAVRDFEGHLYVGTSSWIQCVVPFKKTDVLHSIASLPTAIPGKYYCVNEQDIAGGALAWFLESVLRPWRAEAGEDPDADYAALDRMAASAPAGSHRVIFTPWLNGERTPVDDTSLRAGFHNLSLTAGLPDLVRAVMEGVAYNNRWALGYVEKFIGRRMPWLNLVGGGARSELWSRIFADVLDREIRRVEHPLWANARGAAFIAAVGLGYLEFADVPGLVRYVNVYKPRPELRAVYAELFREYLGLYRNNRAAFRRLNRER